jgi:hypothetical protein
MQDSLNRGFTQGSERTPGGVSQFAADVVARLVSRDGGATGPLRDALVDQMIAAVSRPGSAEFDQLRPELRRARVSAAALADLYIPEIARRLGKAWEDDRMSFAEVTIGSSRLQAILREIGAGWVADSTVGGKGGRTLLLVVPAGEQHTLGAMVLAGQLRRRGISVCLKVGPGDEDLVQLLHTRSFDSAMLSVACVEKLASAAALAKTLKRETAGALPVALGGAAFLREGVVTIDCEADIQTSNIDEALQALGLSQAPARVLERT